MTVTNPRMTALAPTTKRGSASPKECHTDIIGAIVSRPEEVAATIEQPSRFVPVTARIAAWRRWIIPPVGPLPRATRSANLQRLFHRRHYIERYYERKAKADSSRAGALWTVSCSGQDRPRGSRFRYQCPPLIRRRWYYVGRHGYLVD
jgi:hypothetical protein